MVAQQLEHQTVSREDAIGPFYVVSMSGGSPNRVNVNPTLI